MEQQGHRRTTLVIDANGTFSYKVANPFPRAGHKISSTTQKQEIAQCSSDFVLVEDCYQTDQETQGKILRKTDWMKLIERGSFDSLSQEDLLWNLKHGVPNEIRPNIWTTLTKVNEMKAQYPKNLYERLCKMNSKYDRNIKIDVPRTHGHIPFFTKPEYQAQERLTRILKAYAAYDPELGYTQGMNEMVGILLMVMANYNQYQDTVRFPRDCEKNTFWILVYIMKEKGYRDSFKDACPKLMENLYNFETILEEEYPDVLEHMEANGVTVQSAFIHLFLSLACQSTPVEFSIRIIDVFLLNGEKVLTDILLKIIEVCKKDILSLQDDKLMNFFKREMMSNCFAKYKNELNKLLPDAC